MVNNTQIIICYCKNRIDEINGKKRKNRIKFSYAEMSRQLGIARMTFQEAVRREVWSIDMCKRLSEWLGTDVMQFANGQNYTKEEALEDEN